MCVCAFRARLAIAHANQPEPAWPARSPTAQPHRRSPHGPHPLLPPLQGAGQATRAAQAEGASTHGRTQGVARREGGAAQSGGRRSRGERRAPPASPAASRGRRRLRGTTASSQRLPLPLPAPTHSPLPHTSFPPRPRLLWPRLRCPPRALCRAAQRAGALRTLAAARQPPRARTQERAAVSAGDFWRSCRGAGRRWRPSASFPMQQVCNRKKIYCLHTGDQSTKTPTRIEGLRRTAACIHFILCGSLRIAAARILKCACAGCSARPRWSRRLLR